MITRNPVTRIPLLDNRVARAHELLSNASVKTVWACPSDDEAPDWDLVDIDTAISNAQEALKLLLEVRRQQNDTVQLGTSNGMDSSTSALLDAGESPVIRALPVTDKIVPLNWVSGALPEMQRTH